MGVELGAVGLDQAPVGVLVALSGGLEELSSARTVDSVGLGLIASMETRRSAPPEFIGEPMNFRAASV